MKNETPFIFTPRVIGYPVVFVLAIWIIFWIEIRFGFDFTNFGIFPRTLEGLRGILFSPFIHSDIKHLFHNTVPLFVLSLALFYFYREVSWKILLYGLIFSGFLTWAIGRPAYHIGASGIIYLLTGFLFFKGILSRYFRLVALSLIVVFLYGGLLWYITPVDPAISWEGHLAGLLVGLVFAFIFRDTIPQTPKYEWERSDYDEKEDSFMQHFDEEGNFIEEAPQSPKGETKPSPTQIRNEENEGDKNGDNLYRYFYKKADKKD